jgi:cytochrome c
MRHQMLRAMVASSLLGVALQTIPTTAGAESPKAGAFEPCAACHSTDGSNGTGPTLKGVIGRQSGAVAGFRYSRAMRAAGIAWDVKSLDQYLSSPQEFIPGNVMPFSGVADAAERAAIIAYLQTLK